MVRLLNIKNALTQNEYYTNAIHHQVNLDAMDWKNEKTSQKYNQLMRSLDYSPLC